MQFTFQTEVRCWQSKIFRHDKKFSRGVFQFITILETHRVGEITTKEEIILSVYCVIFPVVGLVLSKLNSALKGSTDKRQDQLRFLLNSFIYSCFAYLQKNFAILTLTVYTNHNPPLCFEKTQCLNISRLYHSLPLLRLRPGWG